MRGVERREGSGGGVCERIGADAGGGERVRRCVGVCPGGGPLGGEKMRERDSGGDTLDEDWGDSEAVGLVLACALVVSALRPVAELRVPTFRGGRGGKFFSAVGLGVELRGL